MKERSVKSFWSVLALMLLVQSVCGVLVDRQKRDIGEVVGDLLAADDISHMAAVFEEIEGGIIDYLDDLTRGQEAQDRILLENVQVFLEQKLLKIRFINCMYLYDF